MTIFDREPASWQELQDMVGQLFGEIGCEVKTSVEIENVRGKKEIDVFVRDMLSTPVAVYLCECKFWKRAVPQEVVHAFRSVMADVGAHRGYIISSRGFQRGAHEAATNTNIDLVTFTELQAIFCDRWRVTMGLTLMPYADRLFPYWDPSGGRMPKFRWDVSHGRRNNQLMEVFEPFIRLGPHSQMSGFRRKFPIALPAINERGEIGGQTEIRTYRELYDFLERNKDLALYHFQIVYGEIEPSRCEGEYDPRSETT